MKEKLTWSVDRSSPSNKIRDLMKWSKDILNDIYYQRKILSNPIATFFTKNWWVTHRVIHRMRLHLVPSSRLSNIHHKSNTVVQPNGLVDIQPLKKSIWRFLFISRRFLKLLTVAASISSCDRLFQFPLKQVGTQARWPLQAPSRINYRLSQNDAFPLMKYIWGYA